MSLRYPLPPGVRIRRMRDWRLYDDKGRRYTDFYQYDGAAFLGHRPDGVARVVAAEIDRGLWSAVPTAWPGRYARALEALAGVAGVARLAVVGPGPTDSTDAISMTDAVASGAVSEGPRESSVPRWRPLGGDTPGVSAAVVLPFPPALPAAPGAPLPPPEDLSVVILAGLTRAAWRLTAYIASPEARARLDLAATLPVPPGYRRSGVYFVPADEGEAKGDRALHARRIDLAWRCSIVLPPHPAVPLCVPGELGRMELNMWEALCRDWPR